MSQQVRGVVAEAARGAARIDERGRRARSWWDLAIGSSAALFFDSPYVDGEPAGGRRREWWAALATGVAVAVVTVLRRPLMVQTLWAEDGRDFLGAALTTGRLRSIGIWYEGYLHVIPRLFGAVAASVPLERVPLVMGLGVLVVVGLGSAFVTWVSGGVIRRRWLRVALGLSVGLLPVLGQEAIGNVANIQFFLLFFVFWALLWSPTRPGPALAGSLGLLMLSMSSLLVILLAPLALVRALQRRSWWVRAPGMALLGGTAVHLGLALIVRPHRELDTAADWIQRWDAVIKFFGNYVLANLMPGMPTDLTPVMASSARLGSFVKVLVVAALLLLLVLVGAALRVSGSTTSRRRAIRQRAVIVVATAQCVAFWVVPGLVSPVAPRYAAAPGLLLMTVTTVAADGWLSRSFVTYHRWVRVVPVAALMVFVVGAQIMSFDKADEGNDGELWSVATARARTVCATPPSNPSTIVGLAVAPPGWGEVRVTCAHIAAVPGP